MSIFHIFTETNSSAMGRKGNLETGESCCFESPKLHRKNDRKCRFLVPSQKLKYPMSWKGTSKQQVTESDVDCEIKTS